MFTIDDDMIVVNDIAFFNSLLSDSCLPLEEMVDEHVPQYVLTDVEVHSGLYHSYDFKEGTRVRFRTDSDLDGIYSIICQLYF